MALPEKAWMSLGAVNVLLNLYYLAEGVEVAKALDPPLAGLPPWPGPDFPRISILATALNEEASIERAVRSWLALDYPNLEVVLVNDRSTDRTGAIAARLASEDPRVRTLSIQELPAGWLGKNHALQKAGELATGEYFLFTDADVELEPMVLRRALSVVKDRKIDHLVVLPDTKVPGALSEAFIMTFAFFFNAYVRPHKVYDVRSKAAVGVGAFNFVSAAAYRKIGGHTRLALRVDDDLALGQAIKKNGLRQDVAGGVGSVRVVWYASLREMFRGLEKNMFSANGFRLLTPFLATASLLFFHIWPFVAIFTKSGQVWWLYAFCVASFVGLCAYFLKKSGRPVWIAALFPLGCLMFLYAFWRSTIMTLWRGGVSWRGTLYPMRELKRFYRDSMK